MKMKVLRSIKIKILKLDEMKTYKQRALCVSNKVKFLYVGWRSIPPRRAVCGGR